MEDQPESEARDTSNNKKKKKKKKTTATTTATTTAAATAATTNNNKNNNTNMANQSDAAHKGQMNLLSPEVRSSDSCSTPSSITAGTNNTTSSLMVIDLVLQVPFAK